MKYIILSISLFPLPWASCSSYRLLSSVLNSSYLLRSSSQRCSRSSSLLRSFSRWFSFVWAFSSLKCKIMVVIDSLISRPWALTASIKPSSFRRFSLPHSLVWIATTPHTDKVNFEVSQSFGGFVVLMRSRCYRRRYGRSRRGPFITSIWAIDSFPLLFIVVGVDGLKMLLVRD